MKQQEIIPEAKDSAMMGDPTRRRSPFYPLFQYFYAA
jgi:hypothetical protein